MSEQQQASFNGWARVEVIRRPGRHAESRERGHQTHIGFVRTEVYGQAVMFRVDTPELPERDYTLTEPAYARVNGNSGAQWCPVGSTVRRPVRPGCSVLIGPTHRFGLLLPVPNILNYMDTLAGSIYRIMPCTEEAAATAIDQTERAELMLIALPAGKALTAGAAEDFPDDYDHGFPNPEEE